MIPITSRAYSHTANWPLSWFDDRKEGRTIVVFGCSDSMKSGNTGGSVKSKRHGRKKLEPRQELMCNDVNESFSTAFF